MEIQLPQFLTLCFPHHIWSLLTGSEVKCAIAAKEGMAAACITSPLVSLCFSEIAMQPEGQTIGKTWEEILAQSYTGGLLTQWEENMLPPWSLLQERTGLMLPDIPSGVTPKGHESPGTTPMNTGAPLSVFALDTICQVNLKTLLKVGPDRVVSKELVWVTPVCFCGICPSYFCCPWIFIMFFFVVGFFPSL